MDLGLPFVLVLVLSRHVALLQKEKRKTPRRCPPRRNASRRDFLDNAKARSAWPYGQTEKTLAFAS
jgi:hypothetical protein